MTSPDSVISEMCPDGVQVKDTYRVVEIDEDFFE